MLPKSGLKSWRMTGWRRCGDSGLVVGRAELRPQKQKSRDVTNHDAATPGEPVANRPSKLQITVAAASVILALWGPWLVNGDILGAGWDPVSLSFFFSSPLLGPFFAFAIDGIENMPSSFEVIVMWATPDIGIWHAPEFNFVNVGWVLTTFTVAAAMVFLSLRSWKTLLVVCSLGASLQIGALFVLRS